MKVIALLSLATILDQTGYNATKPQKIYNAKELEPLGYNYLANQDVYDATCTNKRIIKVGDTIKDPAYFNKGDLYLKARYQGNIIYVDSNRVKLRDFLNGCCGSEANAAPAISGVTITNSTPGQLTVAATVTDADTVANVSLYNLDVLLGEDAAAPWSITVSLKAGSYKLLFRAVDTKGKVAYYDVIATVL